MTCWSYIKSVIKRKWRIMWTCSFTRRHQRNGSWERSSISRYWAEPVLWFFSFQQMNHLWRCFMPIFICRIFLHENNASHQTWNITFKCIHLCKLKQTVYDGLITSYLYHAHILHSAIKCLINTLICFKNWHLQVSNLAFMYRPYWLFKEQLNNFANRKTTSS